MGAGIEALLSVPLLGDHDHVIPCPEFAVAPSCTLPVPQTVVSLPAETRKVGCTSTWTESWAEHPPPAEAVTENHVVVVGVAAVFAAAGALKLVTGDQRKFSPVLLFQVITTSSMAQLSWPAPE